MLNKARRVLGQIGRAIRTPRQDEARLVRQGALRPLSIITGPSLPSVSAIVLNRNGAAMLDRMLDSLRAVDGGRIGEVIVVDHGSRDGSRRVVERWRRALPLRAVICGANHTFAYSCNRAAEHATGDMLLFVNNDIVFVEPVVDRLAELAAGGALVGMKLLHDGPGVAPIHHFGLRFRWNERRGLTQPFAPPAGPDDAELCRGIVEMAGVTAATMMCRRDVFLSLGGFCEDYVYGYEDVDLCLKFRAAGRPVLCRNDVVAVHGDRATRSRLPADVRRAWHENNVAVLRTRFGFRLRRELLGAAFADDGSTTGHLPRVVIVGGARAVALAERLEGALSWWCRVVPRGTLAIDLRRADLLIDTVPPPPHRRLRRGSPFLIRLALVAKPLADWREADLTQYIVAAATPAAAARVAADHDLSPDLVPVLAATVAPALLAERLAGELKRRLRILVRHGRAVSAAEAGIVARHLWQAGHLVEVSGPRRQRHGQNDATLWLGADLEPLATSGCIAVSAGIEPVPGVVALPWQGPAATGRAIAALLPDLHAAAAACPREAPLAERQPLSPIEPGWRAAADPCTTLLALADQGHRQGWRRRLFRGPVAAPHPAHDHRA